MNIWNISWKTKKKKDENQDTPKTYDFIWIGSAVVVQWEDGGPWTNVQ